jgi:hypothetical protein
VETIGCDACDVIGCDACDVIGRDASDVEYRLGKWSCAGYDEYQARVILYCRVYIRGLTLMNRPPT